MALISTHTLNGVDGTHAGGVAVTFTKIRDEGSRELLFDAVTDSGGRLLQHIDPLVIESEATYELAFSTGKYWSRQALGETEPQVADEIIIRLKMRDVDASYHVPLILSPHSYSVWVSTPEAGEQ